MLKFTVKLILKENKKTALDLYPIYLRITVNRQSSFISTGYTIPKSAWDKRNECVRESHALHQQINTDILNRKKEVLDKMVTSGVKKESLTAANVKDLAVHREGYNNIFHFAERYQKEMQAKRAEGSTDNFQRHLAWLEKYNGSKALTFEEITPDYLGEFETYLRANIKKRKEDPGAYITTIMTTIRTVFNAALSKEVTTKYPFKTYEMPKGAHREKSHLTIEEIDMLSNYIQTTGKQRRREAAIWFLFGCYTGLRISDWYRFDPKKDVRNGVVVMQTKKTKGWAGVPLYDRLEKHLELVKANPLTLNKWALNKQLNYITKELKLGKHLSSHSARRSFAITMCLERGITSETTAAMMAITLATFIFSYSKITPEKVKGETGKAWAGL